MQRGHVQQRETRPACSSHRAAPRAAAPVPSAAHGDSRLLLAPLTPTQLTVPSSSRPTVAAAGAPSVPEPPASHSRRHRARPVAPAAAAMTIAQPAESPAQITHTEQPFSKRQPIILPNGQKAHSLHDRGADVIQSLSGWAETDLARYLKPVDRSWQPTDFLPNSAEDTFFDQVQELRDASANLPSDYLVVLVGDMVTEEALPSYMNMLNTLDGTRDETGAEDQPWAHWTRHWTAEENRHGDLMNKYLYLSGRVDMRSVEGTIQRLIGSGLDPQLENNPYLCFVYTSFQERATKISHGNTARLAAYHGDKALAKICGIIAADESRHEAAYTAIVDQLFQRDPEGAMLAFADMMKKGIVMPAHFVDDGVHSTNNNGANLFVDYATVADNIGVYTTTDYANIVDHLVRRWRVVEIQGLSGEAAAAQEYLCQHANRIRRLANIQAERRLRDRKRGKTRISSFDWLWGRQVNLS